MANIRPKISIIIPCYNSAQFLGQTLESIKKQAFVNWECLIIVEDSEDDTAAIARQFEKKDKRFKYFHQKDKGVSSAMNLGIKKSLGEFIVFCGSDDIYKKQMLEKSIGYFKKNKNVDAVVSAWQIMDKNSILNQIYLPNSKIDKKLFVLKGAQFVPASAVFRKKIIHETGFFDPKLSSAEDWDMYLRLPEKTRFGKIMTPQVFYRRHADSLSLKTDLLEKNIFKVIDKFFKGAKNRKYKMLKPYSEIYQLLYLAEISQEVRQFGKTKYYLDKALKKYRQIPRNKKFEKDWQALLFNLSYSKNFLKVILNLGHPLWQLEIISGLMYQKFSNYKLNDNYFLSYLYLFLAFLFWPKKIVSFINKRILRTNV